MQGYDEVSLKVDFGQLERIMSILKSKSKSIYISKSGSTLEWLKQLQCTCHAHHHSEGEEPGESEDHPGENLA